MLVCVIPVRSGRLTHDRAIRIISLPFRNRETGRESADIILRQLGPGRLHFLLVLIPKLFILWQHRWPISSGRWTLSEPGGGVVILDKQLLLPVLPLDRPIRPQQRLVAVHARREDLVEDSRDRLLVHHRQAIFASRRWPNVQKYVVGDAAGTGVRAMKV